MKLPVFVFVSLIWISICLSALIAYYSYQRRKAPGAIYLFVMQIAGIIWSTGYIMEILGTTLPEKMIGVKIQYLFGLEFIPVLWLCSILHFTTDKQKPKRIYIALLLIIPTITMFLALFMENHSLFYDNAKIIQAGSFLLIRKSWGAWFYIHVVYSYSLNIFATGLLLNFIFKRNSIYKKQISIWLSAILIPWIANILYVLGMNSFMHLDFSNAAISISAAFFSVAINKYGLFKLIPAAYETVIESMPNGLIVLDSENRVINANPAAIKIFKKMDLIGAKIDDLVKGKKINWNLDHSKESEIFEIEIDEHIYELMTTNIYDKSDTKNGSILNFFDITERIKTEKALNESNAAKDKFFSIIAHDLRSPFFGIMGLADLLANQEEKVTEKEQKEMLDGIRNLSLNTYKMLENLLDWSRSQTGRLEYQPEEIEINACIIENLAQLKNSAELKTITINHSFTEETLVYADRNMINTVIRNFVSNAIKFTRPKGHINISAICVDKIVQVSIEDTGVGIPEKMMTEIFNIDKTSSTVGTSGEKGTGLGLVLCKEFVEKNKGQIWVKSVPGKGSTFTFSIPAINKIPS